MSVNTGGVLPTEWSESFIDSDSKSKCVYAARRSKGKFVSNYVDLIIATMMVLILPISLRFIEQSVGAAFPLLLYYGCCIFLVYDRKKTFDYRMPKMDDRRWIYFVFILSLILVMVQLILVFDIVIPSNDKGWQWTLCIWCPINSSLEQLLWIYIFDAFYWFDIDGTFPQYRESRHLQWIFRGLGWIMCLAFVGMINVLFWMEFGIEFDHNRTAEYAIFLSIKFITIFGYVLLFQMTESMLPLLVLHLLTDCVSVISARYSIVPSLWNSS